MKLLTFAIALLTLVVLTACGDEKSCSVEEQAQMKTRKDATDCGDTSDPEALSTCVRAALDADEAFFFHEYESVCTTDDDGDKTCEPGTSDQPIYKYFFWNGPDDKGGWFTPSETIGVVFTKCFRYDFSPVDGHVECKEFGGIETACEKG